MLQTIMNILKEQTDDVANATLNDVSMAVHDSMIYHNQSPHIATKAARRVEQFIKELEGTASNKELMVAALSQLKDAYNKIQELWSGECDLDLLDNSRYPFDKSFDELGLDEWADIMIEQLND